MARRGMTDEFGLPLIINLMSPEVPKELLGPTPMNAIEKAPSKGLPKKPAAKSPKLQPGA